MPKIVKICKYCGLLEEHYVKSGQCRKCRVAYDRETNLKRRYGMSSKNLYTIIQKQGGKCKLCNRGLDALRATIDHCHTSGYVRGVICNECNVGLGHFNDSVVRLLQAIRYLILARLSSGKWVCKIIKPVE